MGYFHCAPIPLEIGSVVGPGNWGRLIKLYEAEGGTVKVQALNEACLEYARLIHAPNTPSRLNCTFALPSHDAAIQYAQKHSPLSIIFEVEPVDQDAQKHVGDYELAIEPHNGRYFQKIFDRCKRYWTNQSPDFPEVLFSCGLRVIAREL